MTTKKKADISANTNTNTFNLKLKEGMSEARTLTEAQLCPAFLNSATLQSFSITGSEININEACAIIEEKSQKIIAGDLNGLESTLAAQVVSLNAIFVTLARRSANCEYLNQMEINMRLALKAQAQCARSIEILAAIKNPPIIYAKQANIAHGHQQVNNHPIPTHAGKNINSANELLSEDNNATLDTRGTIETSRLNQDLATLETIHGSQDTSR